MAMSPLSEKNGYVLANDVELDIACWTRRASAAATRKLTVHEVFDEACLNTNLHHLVVGIIGPRDATDAQIAAAQQIGKTLGSMRLTLVCGGRGGVMEAASKGCHEAGGLMIGILPGDSPQDANSYVNIALPTGLGEARNMVIAKSARVLIAIGDSFGTLSEVAYGLHFAKPVIGIEGAPDVDGVIQATTVSHAIELALESLLDLAPMVEDAADG